MGSKIVKKAKIAAKKRKVVCYEAPFYRDDPYFYSMQRVDKKDSDYYDYDNKN